MPRSVARHNDGGDSPNGAPPDQLSARTFVVRALADVIVAETIYVLESYYRAPRRQVAEAVRSLIAFPSIVTVDSALLLRAIEVYELDRIDLAEAYLVACAESSGVNRVASFDKSIDRVGTVERVQPSS